ncbi:LysR family transcriptional regulator [Amycolatopsis sp. NPDC024027]|uniref:LysR family transcriptional regulator n=1 Tax=Amycolatopsis sp. NPDC024027 TaxID=3154327 RepID=UPI0033FDFF8C
MLTDLAVLASRILRTTEAPRAGDPHVGDLSGVYRTALVDTDGSGRRPGTAPAHAILAGVATTRALTVLSAADETTAVALLTSLCASGSAGRRMVAPHHSRQRPITPQLAGVLQRARRTLFPAPAPPSFARTSRALTPFGRRRDLLGSVQRCPIRDRSAAIPTVFWPWWTLRLAPLWSMGRLVRGAFACLTVSSGTALSIPATIARLDADVSRAYVAQALQRMATEPAWDAQRAALARIARHLDQHGAPIDYARRRALGYTDLLPEPRWGSLLVRTGFRRHRGTLRSMRCLLFETISGKPASAAPPHYAPRTKIQRDAFSDFPTLLTARLVTELRLVATEFLTGHGIDEPVSWQPPHKLADGLDLPGPDPDTLPRQSLVDLLRADLPLGQAASHSGMTLDAARYLLAHYPRDTSNDHDSGERLRVQLPAETFRDLYLDHGWSISALAARYQVNRRRITTLATAYDIPLRDPSKPQAGISQRWLHEQYVRRGRSSEDLGAELGLHPATILSWCRRYNLPVRPAGPNVHHDALYPTDAIPPELRPALTGSRPWKRLAAFVHLRDHPTLRAAGAAIPIDPKNLARYIRQLERELGQQLVHRSAPPNPITGLTEHGHALANTIATALEQTPSLARTEITRLPSSRSHR